MGVFTSTSILVGSSSSSLSGPPETRPDYLKSTVAAHAIMGGTSMSDTITGAYLKGPMSRLKSYKRWASLPGNYDSIGSVNGTFLQGYTLSSITLAGIIEGIVGYNVVIMLHRHGLADFNVWARQKMHADYPGLVETAWSADFDEVTGEIIITFADTSTHRFVPANFDTASYYVYALYFEAGTDGSYYNPQIFIYRQGDGIAEIDNGIQMGSVAEDAYFPPIPLRIANEMLSEDTESIEWGQAKKAYKKAIGGKLEEISEEIEDMEGVEDIDHAFVVFGVPVNTQDNRSRRYLYEFFAYIIASDYGYSHLGGLQAINEWVEWNNDNYEPTIYEYNEWEETRPSKEDMTGRVFILNRRVQPTTTIRWRASNGSLGGKYDFSLSWAGLQETTGAGLAKPDAEVGEVWFEDVTEEIILTKLTDTFEDPTETDRIAKTRLYWQTSNSTWKAIEFFDLRHRNFVYGGKFVEITLKDALDQAEESGFIVPLHMGVLNETSLINSTQVALNSSYVVYNYYEVKKSNILTQAFKYVLVIAAVVVVTVIFPPAGATVTTALIVNAIVTTVITMIVAIALTAILMPVFVSVFGEKLGRILGTLAIIVLSTMTGNFVQGGGFAMNFSAMSTAEAISKLTSSIGDVYTAFVQGNMIDLLDKTQAMVEANNAALKDIQENYAENIGYGIGTINPWYLTDTAKFSMEPPETFLTRTLLTGSDIAEMSLDMVSNFCELSITTNLPLQ